MKADIYLKLQKQYGGQWVATSKSGQKVYVASQDLSKLYRQLDQKDIKPQQTVIGYVEKSGTVSLYHQVFQVSIPFQKN